MPQDDLGGRIGGLVDHLRAHPETAVSLGEIASVTEVLIGTMRSYFKGIDTAIYREFRNLSEYIDKAKGEIAQLRPNEMQNDRLPRAGRELEAIVKATEEATNTIMESSETIMAADAGDPAAYKALVDEQVMRIFEACSFQDITGQRITKVCETLSYIEDRVTKLKNSLGGIEDAPEAAPGTPDDRSLLNGPQLDGEGVSQSDIDALFN